MSQFVPDIDHVLNATAKAFNDWQKATLGLMTTTPDDLTANDPDNLFNQSRPYYFFKKIAILLCAEKTGATHDDVLAAFKIDHAEYERTKDSFQAWENLNNKQAMHIMERITRTAGLSKLTYKPEPEPMAVAPVTQEIAAPAHEFVWEKSNPAISVTALSQPFSAAVTDAIPSTPTEIGELTPCEKDDRQRLQYEHIKHAVIYAFQQILGKEITIQMLDSKERTTEVAYCRQFGMYVAHACMPSISSSLPCIGRNFGGRDHTTALHAQRKITRKIKTEEPVALAIAKHIAKTLDLSEDQKYALMSGEKISARRWRELPSDISPPASPRSPVSP